jgi:hypothetical protein
MQITRTAQVTRTSMAAIAAALACGLLVMAGCSSTAPASGSDGAASAPTGGGQYFNVTDGQNGDIVTVDGDQITYFDTAGRQDIACNSINTVLKDPKAAAEKGDVDESFTVKGTGKLNQSRTSVDWTEPGRSGTKTGWISFGSERSKLEFVFSHGVSDAVLVPVDTQQGKDLKAKYCGA